MLEEINARTNNFNVIIKIMNESKNKRLKEGEEAERKSLLLHFTHTNGIRTIARQT